MSLIGINGMNNYKNHGLPASPKNRVFPAIVTLNSPVQRHPAGFTLLELLICLALASVIILGLNDIITTTLATRRLVHAENDLAMQAEFAMDRIHRMIHGSRRLLIPLGENPATAWSESMRDVLAVTLDSAIDLDNDSSPDADNDGDGLIDEDLPSDNTHDGAPGIINIDDNNDGITDNSTSPVPSDDNDEDGLASEDWLDKEDNDNDGSVEEDIPADMNFDTRSGVAGIDDDNDGLTDEASAENDDEDNLDDEDWYDAVVYFLVGTTLMERLPVPWDENGDFQVTGEDYVENPLAENVTRFEVTRQDLSSGKTVLLSISLELAGDEGNSYSLTSTLRVGGRT
jgi:prepilin-type N-terminal cleavage/methylation domain-containing protein